MAVRRLALFTPLVYLAFASCVDHPLSPRPPGLRAASVLDTVGAAVLVGAGDIGDCTRIWDSLTANLLDTIPGTVFAAGDNAYQDGTPAEYANCYDPTWGRFKARTRPVPGNHDYYTPGAAGYFGYFGAAAADPAKGYYSYDLGTWHIIALNSNIGMDAGSEQEQWLRADLAAHPALCTLAYWHPPLFSSSTLPVMAAAQATWQDLYNAGAELVINGHHHDYERFAPQTPAGEVDQAHGIREIVVGTGGGDGLFPFGATAAHSEVRNNETFGVLKLTLRVTGYDWKFIPIEGPQFSSFTDSGSGSCHLPPGTLLPQTISFAPLADRTFGDTSPSLNGTASSGLPVSYAVGSGDNCTIAGSTVTITGAGSCSVTATQAGDSTYAAAAPVTQTFAIAKATPALAWSPPTTMVYGSPLSIAQLAATASGVNHTGLAGAFTYAPASDTILGPGTQTVSVGFLPTDTANYTGAGVSAQIAVLYNTVVGHTLLPPIDPRPDTIRVFQIGSIMPVKFQLFYPDGATRVTTAKATIQSILLAGPTEEVVVPASPNQLGGFRDDGQYVFNLSTKGWQAGVHRIIVTLDDGSTMVATVNMRST